MKERLTTPSKYLNVVSTLLLVRYDIATSKTSNQFEKMFCTPKSKFTTSSNVESALYISTCILTILNDYFNYFNYFKISFTLLPI